METEAVRPLVQGGQRLQQDHSYSSPRTGGSREMAGPRKVGDPCPHRALSQRPRQTLTILGRVPPALQETPTPSPTAGQPNNLPVLPPTWVWPCPGPTGGASHPVHLCAGPGGPGRSARAPASTGHSPSPPRGARTLAGAGLSLGPGLDSGAPGHPAGRRHSEPRGGSRRSAGLGM